MNEETKIQEEAGAMPVLADAAITEQSRNFLLAHDKLSIMKWLNDSKEDKIKWIQYLQPKENASEFWSECIRLINEGYN